MDLFSKFKSMCHILVFLSRRYLFWLIIGSLIFILWWSYTSFIIVRPNQHEMQSINLNNNSIDFKHPRDAEIIFIGGHQSTGTGLMRVLMDVHSMVRCGPEPIVTWEIMDFRKGKNDYQALLNSKGVYTHILDEATAAFILSIIVHMGPSAPRLCHKQPGIYYHLRALGSLFRRAKFIHMIRDGRAALVSTIERNVDSQYSALRLSDAVWKWTHITEQMVNDCAFIGERCLTVRYECLVLNPREQLLRILKFLDLPWEENLMKHEKLVKSVSHLSNFEASSYQVVKPIHTDSLNAWIKKNSVVSSDLLINLTHNNIWLKKLGYITNEKEPNYQNMCKNLPPNQLY